MAISTINLNPEESGLAAEDLDTLIHLWLRDIATRIDTKQTMPTYKTAVRFFRRWWESVGPSYGWVLTRRAAEQYEVDLRTTPAHYKDGKLRPGGVLAYRTRKSAIDRLRQMFLWAYRTERVTYNYGLWFPQADGSPPLRIAPTVEHLAALLEGIKATARVTKQNLASRNITIAILMIGAGLRRGEVANLKVEDLQLHPDGTGSAIVTGKRTRRNRGGQRHVALDRATCLYLAAYLEIIDHTTGPLFQSQRGGGPVSPQIINEIIREAIEHAGLAGKVQGCHDLRRAFATYFAVNNPDRIDFLRRQLGHSEYRQTMTYVLSTTEDLRRYIVGPVGALTDNQGTILHGQDLTML